MRVGTAVYTEEGGLGVYMYPHSRPVEDSTICSVYSMKNKKIHHLPYKALSPYMQYCWECKKPLDSSINETCSLCHWIVCPDCKVCKKPVCTPDVMQILDTSDGYGWESVTGFDLDAFFDGKSGSKYYCLGMEEFSEIERCCTALINRQIRPLLVVDIFDMILLYVDIDRKTEAEEALAEINGSLISLISYDALRDIDYYSSGGFNVCRETGYNGEIISIINYDSLQDMDYYPSGSCIICGEPTYNGEDLCSICSGNID